MTVLRCGPLAAWASAWLAGEVAYDDVLGALAEPLGPIRAMVTPVGANPIALGAALIDWRRARAEVRLVLPVAGDLRGLPGPSAFRSAATQAGEAAVGGTTGVIPELRDHAPSSAPPTLHWWAFDIDPPPLDYLDVADAQYELTEAVRDCASALAAADVASARDVREELADARRAGERLNLPASHPAKAVALIAQAERLAAVLDLVAADPHGGAVDRGGIAARTEALRPLITAVRRARLAGYNAAS